MIPPSTCFHGHNWTSIKGGSTLWAPHSSGSCTSMHIASSSKSITYNYNSSILVELLLTDVSMAERGVISKIIILCLYLYYYIWDPWKGSAYWDKTLDSGCKTVYMSSCPVYFRKHSVAMISVKIRTGMFSDFCLISENCTSKHLKMVFEISSLYQTIFRWFSDKVSLSFQNFLVNFPYSPVRSDGGLWNSPLLSLLSVGPH